jgi:hypothetical protein
VRTEKGRELFGQIHAQTVLRLSADDVKAENGGFSGPIAVPEKRSEFFQGLGVAKVDVYAHMKKYVVRKPLYIRMYRALRATLSKLKRRMIR